MRTELLLLCCLLLSVPACDPRSHNSVRIDVEDSSIVEDANDSAEGFDTSDSVPDWVGDGVSEVADARPLDGVAEVSPVDSPDVYNEVDDVSELVDLANAEAVDAQTDIAETELVDVLVEEDVPVPPLAKPVLNEVNCHGQDFVEIANLSSELAADLSGYVLEDGDGPSHRYVLPPGTLVPPLGRVVIPRKTVVVQGFTFGIQCGSDVVRLRDSADVILDEAVPGLVMTGNTWSRLPDGSDNWGESAMTPFGVNQPKFDLEGLLFNPFQVVEIRLTLPSSSVEALWVDPRTYVAGSFALQGAGYDEGPIPVGLRIKGKLGSFRTLDRKSAFKVKFNFADDDERYHGLKKLTLNNMVQDPSMIHEALAYRIFAAFGVPCPRVGYAQLFVNDEPYGLYLILEPYDKITLSRHFPSTQHLYEGEYGEDIVPDMVADFEVDDGDPTDISDLAFFAESVSNEIPDDQWLSALAAVADVPELLAMWAVEQYIGHWDGYAPTINNYYLNSDDDGLFAMLPNGVDQTFADARLLHDGYSYLFSRCMRILECRSQFDQAVGALIPVVELLELDAFASELSQFLAPWWQIDPRKEVTNEQVVDAVQATRDFLSMRRVQVGEWMACLLDPMADLDLDGFKCDGDCDESDATVNAGAFDLCNDGIDQNCNGIPDDDPSCPDCQEVWRGAHRYLICPVGRTWEESRLHCQEVGAEMVFIDGPEEDLWLRAQLEARGLWQCWIGLSDGALEGQFLWLDGAFPTWTNWGGGEPNDWGGNEDCTQFITGGYWNDLNCNSKLAVACEDLCTSPEQDEDHDGALRCNDDCDDSDPTSYPGAEEVEGDDADNDCDGFVDEHGWDGSSLH